MQTSTTITPRSLRGLPLLLGLAALGLAMPAAKVQATIIYQDDFIGGTIGTDLKNSVPDVRLGSYGGSASATWSATTGDWLFNGAGVSSTKADKSFASLPFTPQATTVYILDWTWTQSSGPWWIIGLRTGWDHNTVTGNVRNGIVGTNHAVVTLTMDDTTGYTAHVVFNGATPWADTTGLRSAITAVGFITQAGGSAGTAMTSMSLTRVDPLITDAANSTVTANPTTVASDGVTTSTITVTLKDASSNPARGKTVTLASSRGATDTISAASGTSSTNGVVTFTVKSSTAGSPVFTATDTNDNVVVTQTATVTFTAGAVSAANSTVAALPTSVTADGATASTITVTLKDGNTNAAAGKIVTLASSRGATDTISAASGASDANGVVTFTVTSTTAGAPVFTATDTDDNVVVTQTATVTFTVGAVNAGTSTVAAAPTKVQADGATTSTITVTLKDAYNNPVAGKTVTLVSSRVAEDTISAASGTSSVSGVVTFTVTSTTAGSSVFTATGDGVLLTPTATVTFGPSAAASTVAASPTSVTADGSTTSTITVTLKDAGNQPVTNKTVTLAKTSGPGTPVITTVSGTTDTSGVATFTVTSTTAGADVFTATDTTDGVTVTPTATVTFTAGAVSAGTSTVTASPTLVTADGATPSTITVTLKDAGNNPVSGKTVSLAHTSGPGSPVITTNSNVTDASGHATFTVTSTTLGADVFTATDDTDNIPITSTATVNFVTDVVIYSDDFIGDNLGADLNTSVPDVRRGSYGGSATATWTARVGDWKLNGAGAAAQRDCEFAWLPFSPVANAVYTLDWTWTAGDTPWWIIGTRHNGWDYSSVAGLSRSRTGTNHVVVTITTDGANGYTTHTVYNGTLASTNDTSGSRSNITCIGLIQQAGGSNTTVMKSLLLTYVPATPPGVTYADWAGSSGYNLTGGANDDDDGDGMSNYDEYVFGLNPTTGTSVNPVTDISELSGLGKFTYTRTADTSPALVYTVWVSTDLADWGIAPAAATQTPRSLVVDGVETVDVTLTDYAPPPGGKLFVRVQAE
ncbi:MAG: Ig-like domain-containing protein [Verrucomicrobia bacterium]|nr:Ig-like domain-containing protein [Verrucomicrobiota bacterium]